MGRRKRRGAPVEVVPKTVQRPATSSRITRPMMRPMPIGPPRATQLSMKSPLRRHPDGDVAAQAVSGRFRIAKRSWRRSPIRSPGTITNRRRVSVRTGRSKNSTARPMPGVIPRPVRCHPRVRFRGRRGGPDRRTATADAGVNRANQSMWSGATRRIFRRTVSRPVEPTRAIASGAIRHRPIVSGNGKPRLRPGLPHAPLPRLAGPIRLPRPIAGPSTFSPPVPVSLLLPRRGPRLERPRRFRHERRDHRRPTRLGRPVRRDHLREAGFVPFRAEPPTPRWATLPRALRQNRVEPANSTKWPIAAPVL